MNTVATRGRLWRERATKRGAPAASHRGPADWAAHVSGKAARARVPEWWAQYKVRNPGAADAALSSLPNLVMTPREPPVPGFDVEVRMPADSRETQREGPWTGRVAATLYFGGEGTRMRLYAASREEREAAQALLDVLLGGALRLEGTGVA